MAYYEHPQPYLMCEVEVQCVPDVRVQCSVYLDPQRPPRPLHHHLRPPPNHLQGQHGGVGAVSAGRGAGEGAGVENEGTGATQE